MLIWVSKNWMLLASNFRLASLLVLFFVGTLDGFCPAVIRKSEPGLRAKRKGDSAFSDRPSGKPKSDNDGKLPDVEKQYQYVRGGFREVSPAQEGRNSSIYAAFDSALRASSYNMFCSPLVSVTPPTQFRAKRQTSDAEVRQELPLEEDPLQAKERIKAQYQELDLFFSRDKDVKRFGSNKPIEPPNKPIESRRREEREAEPEASVVPDSAPAAESITSALINDEGYDDLQRLLGFRRMAKSSRMDDPSFKGNMTAHRKVTAFCFSLHSLCLPPLPFPPYHFLLPLSSHSHHTPALHDLLAPCYSRPHTTIASCS